MNSLFRNEGSHLSSNLIRWAVAHTRAAWPDVPDLGIVSFVDAKEVRTGSPATGVANPGKCYLKAGWSNVGFTKAGLHVFQQLPDQRIGHRSEPMPEASPVPGWQAALFDLEAS